MRQCELRLSLVANSGVKEAIGVLTMRHDQLRGHVWKDIATEWDQMVSGFPLYRPYADVVAAEQDLRLIPPDTQTDLR